MVDTQKTKYLSRTDILEAKDDQLISDETIRAWNIHVAIANTQDAQEALMKACRELVETQDILKQLEDEDDDDE